MEYEIMELATVEMIAIPSCFPRYTLSIYIQMSIDCKNSYIQEVRLILFTDILIARSHLSVALGSLEMTCQVPLVFSRPSLRNPVTPRSKFIRVQGCDCDFGRRDR